MNNSIPVLLRVGEVAFRFSCSRKEVYRLIREGQLPACRIGEGHYRVRETDLAVFLEGTISSDTSAVRITTNPSTVLPAIHADKPHVNGSYSNKIDLPIPPELNYKQAEAVVLLVPPADTFTIAYLVEQWLDDARGRVRAKTYLSYAQMARLHILPVLGPWRVDRLDIRTLERFLQWKYQSGLSARGVQYLRALLRQAYNEAIRWGWLSRNIAALARGPKAERPQIEVPSHEEAYRLLSSFEGIRHGPLFITTLGLGLRLGEVLGLRWSDVCLPDPKQDKLGQLTVRVQLQRFGGECELLPPKSKTSIRSLSLPSFVAVALAKRRDQQREEWIKAGNKWRNEFGLIFTNRFGAPLDDSRVRQRFSEHLQRHGFAHMRFHDLRHLSASLLLSQGTHPRVLMEILGHSQISLTLDTYCHLMPSAYPEVARAMENAVKRRTEF